MTFNYKKIIIAILLVAISQPVYPGWLSTGLSWNNTVSSLVNQAKESPILTGACVAGALALSYYGMNWYKQKAQTAPKQDIEKEIREGLQAYRKGLAKLHEKQQESPHGADVIAQPRVQDVSGQNSPATNSPAPIIKNPLQNLQEELASQATAELPDFQASDDSQDKGAIFSDEDMCRIREGNTILRAMIDGKYKNPRSEQEHLDAIINVIWALYKQADQKGQSFTEGTFVVEDKDFRLFNFLMDYVKRCNEKITGTSKDNQTMLITNPFACCRISSHYTEEQKTNKHYGIDIQKTDNLPLLPTGKCHLLFGKIDEEKNLLFIKPENYGLYQSDVIAHGLETLKAKVIKLYPNGPFGSDDGPDFRKERVPQAFIKEAQQQFENIFGSSDLSTNLTDKVKKFGFKILFDMRDNPTKYIKENNTLQLDFTLAINAMIQTYTQQYDNLEIRTGREVIILQKDLEAITDYQEEQTWNVSILDADSGFIFVAKSPKDILDAAQTYLEHVQQYQQSSGKSAAGIDSHIARIAEINIELNALLMRTSGDTFIWEDFKNMVIDNLKKCGNTIQADNVYRHIYGDDANKAQKYSYLTIREDIDNKLNAAITEDVKKDLRQLLYFFRSQIMKENFDAYLEGEAAIKNLSGRDISFEEISDLRTNLGMIKAELDYSLKQLKK